VSLSLDDEVPHIFTRKLRLGPAEFLITGAKRLLQHNPSNRRHTSASQRNDTMCQNDNEVLKNEQAAEVVYYLRHSDIHCYV